MSQAARLILSFVVFLVAISAAHGVMNLGWLDDTGREQLVVAHLPVT